MYANRFCQKVALLAFQVKQNKKSAGSGVSGNVLFLILIAVALFAALSYVVVQSSRGTAPKNSENAQMQAAAILGFHAAVKNAVNQMMLRGVDFSAIAFNTDAFLRMDGLPLLAMGSPANPQNYVFHPLGGAVIPLTFEQASTPCPSCTASNTQPGHWSLSWSNHFPSDGTDLPDVIISLSSVNLDVCNTINKALGIDDMPVNLVTSAQSYTTGSSIPSFTAITGADIPKIIYKTAYCSPTTGGRYNFRAVVKSY